MVDELYARSLRCDTAFVKESFFCAPKCTLDSNEKRCYPGPWAHLAGVRVFSGRLWSGRSVIGATGTDR